MTRKFITGILFVILSCMTMSAKSKEPLKVLAIGNSFSVDAVEQNLHEIADADGVRLIIGNMYIGGCSIDRHVECLNGDLPAYSYRKIDVVGVKTETPDYTLNRAIKDEKWDIITVQQCSPDSGKPETYAQLGVLLSWIKENCPKAKIYFHQTWAYSKTSSHSAFVNYGHDQVYMYNSIMGAVKKATKEFKIKKVIPSGTAIQNARGTLLGDDLTRDGYHLDLRIGRYIAAATWYEVLTGKSVIGNLYCPSNVSPLELRVAQQAAHSANKSPYKVTKY